MEEIVRHLGGQIAHSAVIPTPGLAGGCGGTRHMMLAGRGRTRLLVLIDTEKGGTLQLARDIVMGMNARGDCEVDLMRVPPAPGEAVPEAVRDVPEIAHPDVLTGYHGIAFGSPVHFAGMSSAMRLFLDRTVTLWTGGMLQGVPATVFVAAGSGAGREAAILSFWNALAVHGMVIVSPGIAGTDEIEQRIPQANTPFGAATAASMPGLERPSQGERHIARLQGAALARVAHALAGSSVVLVSGLGGDAARSPADIVEESAMTAQSRLEAMGVFLPDAPAPVGNYKSWRRSGDLIFINQIALLDGTVFAPGIIGGDVDDGDARKATRITILNAVAVLKDALDGDLDRVRQCVQLTGFFATTPDYAEHATLLDEASRILVGIWGDAGMHARAAIGASALPMRTPCELQLVVEVD